MNINTIAVASAVTGSTGSSKTPARPFPVPAQEPAAPPTRDTVTLSAQALQRAEGGVDGEVTEDMKMAAIPSWYADYHPVIIPVIGMPAMEMDRINARFHSLSESEQAVFYSALQKHYLDMKSANHLDSPGDAYEALIKNKESSERLRVEFEQRIASDSTLMGLLTKMGIKASGPKQASFT